MTGVYIPVVMDKRAYIRVGRALESLGWEYYIPGNRVGDRLVALFNPDTKVMTAVSLTYFRDSQDLTSLFGFSLVRLASKANVYLPVAVNRYLGELMEHMGVFKFAPKKPFKWENVKRMSAGVKKLYAGNVYMEYNGLDDEYTVFLNSSVTLPTSGKFIKGINEFIKLYSRLTEAFKVKVVC